MELKLNKLYVVAILGFLLFQSNFARGQDSTVPQQVDAARMIVNKVDSALWFYSSTTGFRRVRQGGDTNKYINNIVKAGDTVKLNYIKANTFFDDGGTTNVYRTERSGNTLYGLLDDYTGEEVTFSKLSNASDADVDGVLIRKKGSEYFRRVWDGAANIRWWGADYTGTSEATAQLQKAINSKVDLQAQPGDEYLISPLLASNPGQQIHLANAKMKLKPNSGNFMLKVTAKNVIVDGGEFDGNKGAGMVTSDFGYDHAAVAVVADSVTVQNITSINSFGFGVKAVGSNITVANCKIYNHTLSGVYIEPSGPGAANVLKGNRVINNVIDGAGGLGGGIYMVSYMDGLLPTWYQTGWVISGNTIRCATGGWPDEAHAPSCIYPRARGGIISNNTLYGGYFGITEGGPGSVINGNRIETRGDSSLAGIEVHFNDNIISNNFIKGYFFNILSSGTAIGSNCNITGNNLFNWRNAGIFWQADPSLHSNNLNITNNIFRKDTAGANVAIYLTWPVQHVNITGNTLRGNNNGGGSGIVLERTGGEATITNNSFGGFSELVACYAAVPDTFNNILFCFNELSDSTIFNRITPGGEGVLGTGIVEAFNTKNGFLGINFDRSKNVLLNLSHGEPEGYMVASPGSIAINEYGGTGRTVFIKDTGTGVLGWKPIATPDLLEIYVDKINDQIVRGIKTFKDVLRVDSGNILNGSGLSFAYDSVGAKIQSFGAKPLIIEKLGNGVGIGDVIPTHTLDVNGEVGIQNTLHLGSANVAGEIWFKNKGDSTMLIITVKDTPTIQTLFNKPLNVNPVANGLRINGYTIQKLDDELNIDTYVSGTPAILGRQFTTLDQLKDHTDSLHQLIVSLDRKIDSISTGGITDYVTLSTDQTITGKKVFNNDVQVSGGSLTGGGNGLAFTYDSDGGHIQTFNLKTLKFNELGNDLEFNGILVRGQSGRLTIDGKVGINDAADSSDAVTYRQLMRKINNTTVSSGSYLFANSVVNTSGTVTLVNDDGAPGNFKYYGTDQEGTKGFFDFPNRRSFTLLTASYTVEAGVKVVFANYSGGTATVTLPSPSGNLDEEITVKNLTTNNVSVTPVSANDTNTLLSYGAITYKSDGTTWHATSKY
jgi:hypothetical protein